MAQRKSPPSGRPSGTRPTGSKPGSKPAGSKPAGGAKTNLTKTPVGRPAVRKPPPRKGKSIVNQKQTPWGMIIATAAVVLFAVVIVVVVIVTKKSDPKASYLTELPAAANINGVTFREEPNRQHKLGVIKYDATPPVGGNHNPVWADCTGTAYPKPIANENAVHMLEHGAIWITYNAKTLPASQLAALKKNYVSGIDRMALSPYPNLKAPISLQAWGYQLFVQKESDPRIAKFIAALKYNPKTTPEYGATCSDTSFIQNPSTFGHPTSSGTGM